MLREIGTIQFAIILKRISFLNMTMKERFAQIVERELEQCPEWLRPKLKIQLIQEFEEKYGI
jgi:hypothetical protein